MYTPSSNREKDEQKIWALIERAPFATLLSPGGEMISHLPLLPERTPDGKIQIKGHMARANPHWRELEKLGRAKALFHGPHAYISPAWYTPKADNVPTWNYTVVHATGNFEIVREPEPAFEIMQSMVQSFETFAKTGWTLPLAEPAVTDLMRELVVFRIIDLEFLGKFKLSQRQGEIDRQNVIEALRKSEHVGDRELAESMADATLPEKI